MRVEGVGDLHAGRPRIVWEHAPPPPPEETLVDGEPPPVPEEDPPEDTEPLPLPEPPRHIKLGGKLGRVELDDSDGLDLTFEHPFGFTHATCQAESSQRDEDGNLPANAGVESSPGVAVLQRSVPLALHSSDASSSGCYDCATTITFPGRIVL